MILFVHIPKTAGTSFRIGLEQVFGPQRLILDYGPDTPETDKVIKQHYCQRPFKPAFLAEIASAKKSAAVCGHFPVSRYLKIFPEATVISFVREPLQRCYSEYLQFRRYKNYTDSFNAFFQQKHQINLQSKFLETFPNNGIIGCSEHYDQSLGLIYKLIGISIPVLRFNRNRKKIHIPYSNKIIGEKNVNLFYQLNSQDVSLYQTVKEKVILNPDLKYSKFLQCFQQVKVHLILSINQRLR
jgi:hypothetical protein